MFEPTVQRCDVKEFPYLEISVKFGFSKKATKIKKSSPSIWHLLHNVKSTVKISSIFAAFLENMNFTNNRQNFNGKYTNRYRIYFLIG